MATSSSPSPSLPPLPSSTEGGSLAAAAPSVLTSIHNAMMGTPITPSTSATPSATTATTTAIAGVVLAVLMWKRGRASAVSLLSGSTVAVSSSLSSSTTEETAAGATTTSWISVGESMPTTETDNTTARALLTKQGFDPDNLSKVCVVDGWNFTPLIFFCWKGKLLVVRYLIFIRGADWRETDMTGRFPLYWAAMAGHLEIIKFLCHECGAHEDVRRVSNGGTSPLEIAFYHGHFRVVPWLILNGALTSPLRRRTSSRIHTYTMRRALLPDPYWDYDKRLQLEAWAKAAVATHDQFQLSSFIPLVELKGNSGVLEIIAGYCGYRKRRELRIIRKLLHLLLAFIKDVPFVPSRGGGF